MIPRGAHPSSVFLMLSLANFKLAIKQWLRYSLHDLGYDVCFSLINPSFNSPNMQVSIFDSEQETASIYSCLMQNIMQTSRQHQMVKIKEKEFRVIVERTVQFKNTKNALQENFLEGKMVCL